MDKQVIQLVDAFVIQHNLVQVLSNVNLAVQAGEFAYINSRI
jgi:ABC-type lipoprotein export system ATPase subunit